MNIFISGGFGFVGSSIARYFIEKKHNVTIATLSRSNEWRLEPFLNSIDIVQLDITNPTMVRKELRRADPNIVINNVAYGIYHENDQMRVFNTNLFGAINMLNAYLELNSDLFINTSTVAEYGIIDKKFYEDDALKPLGDYGVSKASATLFSESVRKTTGRKIVTTRISNAYGPYERPQNIIPYLIMNRMKNDEVKLNSPNNRRDFIYIDDVAEAYGKIVSIFDQIDSSIFNVATGITVSIGELTELVDRMDIVSEKLKLAWNSDQPRIMDRDSYHSISTKRINNELKWKPKYTVKEGIERFYLWIKEINEKMDGKLKDMYYISHRSG